MIGKRVVAASASLGGRHGSIIAIVGSDQERFPVEDFDQVLRGGTFSVLLEDGTTVKVDGEDITQWHLIQEA